MNLWAEFLTNPYRKMVKWAHYFPIYERHFSQYVGKPVTIIEIGVGKGGSLQLWKRYFGPFARIVGIDVMERCKEYEEQQISVRIGEQQDTAFLQSLIDEFGAPDIVLDDGSHVMNHITESFRFLYPKLAKNGIYLVEDLQTAYAKEFGGGAGEQTSFIEVSKTLIDEINAHSAQGAVAPTEFTDITWAMHFYDGVVVFERGQRLPSYVVTTGQSSWKGLRSLST